MSNLSSWIRRGFAGLVLFVLVRGVLLWLGTLGIHPDQWVANMLNWASSQQTLNAIAWTIAGLSGLVGLMFWPRLEPLLHGLVGKRRGGLMSMRDAALFAYDELDGTEWRNIPDREADPEVRLAFIATYIAHNAPVVGKALPSRKLKLIPYEAFRSGIFVDGGNSFHSHGKTGNVFVDLHVEESDLRDALKRMKQP